MGNCSTDNRASGRRQARPRVIVLDEDARSAAALCTILRPFADVTDVASIDRVGVQPSIIIVGVHQASDVARLPDLDRLAPQARIIVVADSGSQRSALEGYRQGAYAYLMKPVDMAELVGLVHRLAVS